WVDPCPLRDMLMVRNIVRSGFSLSNTDSLWLRADVIDWYHVIWFPHCIPRHAIHMWLVIKEKLKTQDRLRQWDVGPSIDLNPLRCPLCDMGPDSHSHLFFECSFASQVWFQVRASTSMSSVPSRLVDVLAFLIQSKGALVSNKKKSTADQIVQFITSLVRTKLVTFKFKKMSTGSRLLLDQWKIPSSCFDQNRSSRLCLCLWHVINTSLSSCMELEVNVEASLDEERFLRQKSKIEWLNAGDANTAYFHRIVKSKCARNRIEMVRDSSNVLHEGNAVPGAFVSHYEQFLRLEDSEIKDAIFSMRDDKALGLDGFTAAFFKKSWDIVGGEIIIAVRDFFTNGKLLKELNHTIISLIPKVSTPAKINDYRPIYCCNVLFKCVSKIIANLIKEDLGDLISINQSAFVSGRRISDNILLTKERMQNYHRKRGPPRCVFKVDIRKAYDTVDWGFLRSILVGFEFHPTMIEWIMVCVSTTSYFVCINRDMYGWFNGKRGLRTYRQERIETSNKPLSLAA
ncbi:protein LAZ1, partial [Tanacetum coccineum]